MSGQMDRRYKMVQYMVWAQLVLLAIVAAFVCLTGEDVMWRWDLPFGFCLPDFCSDCLLGQ